MSIEDVEAVSLFHTPCLFMADLPKNKTTFDV